MSTAPDRNLGSRNQAERRATSIGRLPASLGLGVRLLSDLWAIFQGHDVLSTDTILTALNGLEEAPWG